MKRGRDRQSDRVKQEEEMKERMGILLLEIRVICLMERKKRDASLVSCTQTHTSTHTLFELKACSQEERVSGNSSRTASLILLPILHFLHTSPSSPSFLERLTILSYPDSRSAGQSQLVICHRFDRSGDRRTAGPDDEDGGQAIRRSG